MEKALPGDASPDFIAAVVYQKADGLRTTSKSLGLMSVVNTTDRGVYVLAWNGEKYLLHDQLPYAEITAVEPYRQGAYEGVWIQTVRDYNVILLTITSTGAMHHREHALQLQRILKTRVPKQTRQITS
jgi:hypothetical protein